jgi:hypothetical protein
MGWNVNITQLQHRREVWNNSLTFTASVWQTDANGVQQKWNPWMIPNTLFSQADIPFPGDRLGDFDNAIWAGQFGAAASWPYYKDFYRVRTVDWSGPVAGSISTYQVTITATDHSSHCPEPLIERQDSTVLRKTDRYRREVPSTATNNGDVISGTNYSETNGKPEAFNVPQVRILLTGTWLSDDPAYTDGWPDFTTLYAPVVNRVNSAAFLGFPIGSVMFVGATITPRQDEASEMTLEFIWDQWYWFDQEPTRHIDGSPKLSSGQCAEVKWKDLSVGTFDFTSMLTDDELLWASTGWKAWDTSCIGPQQEQLRGTTNVTWSGLKSEAVP